jgi:methanogenic corrinoid protein MtbC1
MPEEAAGPTILLTTLPGEIHRLGLQMAAAMVALAEARPSLLGIETPPEEIAAAAEDVGADAVCISVSLATAGVGTDRVLARLRKLLPREIPIVVGGRGARGGRRGPRGITWLADLNVFESWIRERF